MKLERVENQKKIIKYNVYKRNPSKEEFEKFKNGLDLRKSGN